MYGLQQALRQRYKKFESFTIDQRYNKTNVDHIVFPKKFSNGYFIILLLCEDNMLIIGHDFIKIQKLKRELSKSFAVKDIGPAKLQSIFLTREPPMIGKMGSCSYLKRNTLRRYWRGLT